MSAKKPTLEEARAAFQEAIEAAEHLELQEGLYAIKRGEGRGKISARSPTCLLGSVSIDDNCRSSYANACRWDYVIGYFGEEGSRAWFIEVHSADTSNVSEVEKKLNWLIDFLKRNQQSKLYAFPRFFVWVQSGRNHITKNTPRYRKLQVLRGKKGLKGPVSSLELI